MHQLEEFIRVVVTPSSPYMALLVFHYYSSRYPTQTTHTLPIPIPIWYLLSFFNQTTPLSQSRNLHWRTRVERWRGCNCMAHSGDWFRQSATDFLVLRGSMLSIGGHGSLRKFILTRGAAGTWWSVGRFMTWKKSFCVRLPIWDLVCVAQNGLNISLRRSNEPSDKFVCGQGWIFQILCAPYLFGISFNASKLLFLIFLLSFYLNTGPT